MSTTGAPNKLLLLAAAIAIGYLGTSAYFHFFPPDIAEPVAHAPPAEVTVDRETLLAQQSSGVDLPPDVRDRMLGRPPPPKPTLPPAGTVDTNLAFVIGEALNDQVLDMKERMHSPEGSHQENGITDADLDKMRSEGRMAW